MDKINNFLPTGKNLRLMEDPQVNQLKQQKFSVFNDVPGMDYVLCKPKLLPIKSATLRKLEKQEATQK